MVIQCLKYNTKLRQFENKSINVGITDVQIEEKNQFEVGETANYSMSQKVFSL